MKFCRYCGIQEPDDNAIYCEHCGKAFSNVTSDLHFSVKESVKDLLNKSEFDNEDTENTSNVIVHSKKELKELIDRTLQEKGNECDLNFIDVSLITDMSLLFANTQFNGDISNWNVSNVTDMSLMFFNSCFNGDISNWNVSNVVNMSSMFSDSQFNGDISKWDISNVTRMESIFLRSEFNGTILDWNISSLNVSFKDIDSFYKYLGKKLPLAADEQSKSESTDDN